MSVVSSIVLNMDLGDIESPPLGALTAAPAYLSSTRKWTPIGHHGILRLSLVFIFYMNGLIKFT